MQRAASRFDEGEFGAVGICCEQFGEQNRKRNDERTGDAARDQRPDASADARPALLAIEPVPRHESREHINLEQRDLIAPKHDQRACNARKNPIGHG